MQPARVQAAPLRQSRRRPGMWAKEQPNLTQLAPRRQLRLLGKTSPPKSSPKPGPKPAQSVKLLPMRGVEKKLLAMEWCAGSTVGVARACG